MKDMRRWPFKSRGETSAKSPPPCQTGASCNTGAQKEHPLDAMAQKYHCFVSDLRLDPSLRREALLDLSRCEESAYTLKQWQDAVNYLTEGVRTFENAAEAKRCILRWLKASKLRPST